MPDIVERLQPALAGRYAVVRELGRGGMALVYLADDLKHHRRVALKVLRPDLALTVGAERFLAEIAICAGLAHPNVVPLYDSGQAGDLLFYVMPYLEGESLRQRMAREGQLPLEEALHIARGVAAALGYAHARGIVHRDIKPENILLVADEPVVADFGIAKALAVSDTGRITVTGLVVGTPAYMSPEQGSGEQTIDGRSDIYSLGCVLFEMLSSAPPYTGPSHLAITASKLVDPLPKLRERRTSVPPAVEEVVAKALAREPADRYATAQQLAQALAGLAGASAAAGGPAPGPSVAVLPFVSLSGEPEDDFLGDGISEELIHVLSRIEGVRVVARTSAFAFKGKPEDVRTIGARLNVGAILEGSVRKAGKRLRVTTQLVNVADGYQLWSERYDRELDDVFAVQDDIARATAEALKVTLLGPAAGGPGRAASGFAAYELYLRGRHAWNRRTEQGLRQSVEYFERALAADRSFALAHAGLADSRVTLGIYGVERPDDVMPAAQAAAERALALDPNLAEARTSLGCVRAVYRWDWAGAEEEFRRAIALKPGYPTARHWHAINCLAPQGRFAEARSELELAHTYDPLSATVSVSLGLVSFFERDYARAAEEFDRVIELEPGFGMSHFFLGQVREQEARLDDAITALRTARTLTGDSPEVIAALGHALARAGSRQEAERLERELVTRSTTRYVSPVVLAQVWLALGRRDEALAGLEAALEVKATELIWLRVRPVFDAVRDEPRFAGVVRRVGLFGG